MRRYVLAAGVLLFAACLLSPLLSQEQARSSPLSVPEIPERDFARQEAYEVLEVIDGDTVKISYQGEPTSVRLIGVDTPETVHPTKPVEFYGKQASSFLDNLLKGESVYAEVPPPPGDRDKYGRLLAYLYRAPDGLFVNLEIIRQGYGHAYTVFPFGHMELFRYYEKKARECQKGLWNPEVQTEPEARLAPGVRPSVPVGKQVMLPAPRSSTVGTKAQSTATVYITKTGKKYHLGGCRYLSKSKIPISLADAKRGYGPCSVCKPPK